MSNQFRLKADGLLTANSQTKHSVPDSMAGAAIAHSKGEGSLKKLGTPSKDIKQRWNCIVLPAAAARMAVKAKTCMLRRETDSELRE
jgi:hypothetical protein